MQNPTSDPHPDISQCKVCGGISHAFKVGKDWAFRKTVAFKKTPEGYVGTECENCGHIRTLKGAEERFA